MPDFPDARRRLFFMGAVRPAKGHRMNITIAVRICMACSALAAPVFCVEPALTIYNQNFAVVRETIPLDLKQGSNRIRFAGTTAHLEPESVILRDPSGRWG